MTDLERLIVWLLEDFQDGSRVAIPPEAAQQERLLRSLMNGWQPQEKPEAFWVLQDRVLSKQLARKGVIDAESLPACKADPRIVLWQGDITRLNATAIVNAANSALLGCFIPCHGCIDNAIHSAAGLQLRLACARLMQGQGHEESTGDAKLTSAFNLPSNYVLHTVGPIVRGGLSQRDRTMLTKCYMSCLKLAAEKSMDSLAFCCISTGEFGFPQREAAEIAIQAVRDFLKNNNALRKVIFNVFKDSDFSIYHKLLDGDSASAPHP